MHAYRLRIALLGLVVLSFCSLAAAAPLPVQKIEFDAPSVGRKMKFNLILPADYEKSNKRYPVLYLLHGLTSNYMAWATMKVPDYAAEYDLIVVMPDVGNSWYVNWAKSEDGQKNNWEDFIVKDLVGYIDSNYRTIAKREGRAINGLSMGGFGGIMLGLRHPDMFCSCGSHSGALSYAAQAAGRMRNGTSDQAARGRGNAARGNVAARGAGRGDAKGRGAANNADPNGNRRRVVDIEGFATQDERRPRGTAFTTADEASAYDPFQLVLKVPKDKLPHIYIDCGTEDSLIRAAHDFAKVLMDNKIPFTYSESPGGHSSPYWSREVGHSMAVQYAIIQRALAKAGQ